MDKMSNLMGSISVLSQKEATRGTISKHWSLFMYCPQKISSVRVLVKFRDLA